MGITEFLDPEFVRDRLDEDLTALRDDVRGVDDRTLTHVYDRLGGMLGTVPAVQSVEELRSGTLTVSNVYGVDAGGTVHQVRVDPTDGRLENYLTEPGGGVIDGRNIRYLTQDDILGTVSVVKSINELKGGTVDQVVGNVTVDATDLDIRDLTSVSDSVAIVQGGALKTGATLSADNIGLFKPGNDVGAVATLKSGTIDVARSYGVDAGGTVHQVRVDPADGRLENYLVEPGATKVDPRSIRYLTQDDVLGTIGVTKTVQTVDELKSGTIDVAETVQTVDELRSGTIDQVKLLQSGNVSSTIAADDVGLLKTADQPLDVSSASVPVIQPLDMVQASGLTVGATLAVDNVGLFKKGQGVSSTIAADSVGLLKTADQPLDVSSASIPVLQPLRISQASGLTVGSTITADKVGLFKKGQGVSSTLAADNIGLLKTVDQPLDVSGASIPVLQPLNITPDPRDRNWTVTETVDIAQASGVTVGATLTTDNIGLFKPGNDVGAVATLKSGTIDVARSYGVDAGGTVHQVRVDPTDGRLQNYLVEPGGGIIDGRNIRYLTQNDVLGTVSVVKDISAVSNILDISGGSIAAVDSVEKALASDGRDELRVISV